MDEQGGCLPDDLCDLHYTGRMYVYTVETDNAIAPMYMSGIRLPFALSPAVILMSDRLPVRSRAGC
jgi:hypothetical protein